MSELIWHLPQLAAFLAMALLAYVALVAYSRTRALLLALAAVGFSISGIGSIAMMFAPIQMSPDELALAAQEANERSWDILTVAIPMAQYGLLAAALFCAMFAFKHRKPGGRT